MGDVNRVVIHLVYERVCICWWSKAVGATLAIDQLAQKFEVPLAADAISPRPGAHPNSFVLHLVRIALYLHVQSIWK